jgi:hypothetical protein
MTIVVHALSIRGLSVTQFNSLHLCIPVHVSNEIDELLRGHFSLVCVDLQFSHLFEGCKYLFPLMLRYHGSQPPSKNFNSWLSTEFQMNIALGTSEVQITFEVLRSHLARSCLENLL